MDGDLEEMSDDLWQQEDEIIEKFNNVLAMLLARMTREQMQQAIGNKSDTILNNIFKSAFNREDYEVCHVIKEELDKRKANEL